MGKAVDFYNALANYMEMRREQSGINNKILIHVGSATCENAAGSDIVRKEFEKLINASGRDDILLKQTGCTGRCARAGLASAGRSARACAIVCRLRGARFRWARDRRLQWGGHTCTHTHT